jgi:glycosyltransferase involved in cell wall biosynthesis
MGVKPRVLVVSPWYAPGFKAGGVVRAVQNMVEALAGELDISIVTSDRDLLDSAAYPGVDADRWLERDGYRILYLSPGGGAYRTMARAIRGERWDTVHVSGVFDPLYNLWPVLVARAQRPSRRPRVVVQVHGMFGAGALRIKAPKKRSFLAAARALQFYRGVTWHASTAQEASEIHDVFGPRALVEEAANVPDRPRADPPDGARGKRAGEARFCFFSRVSPKKGLLEALRFLARSSAGPGVILDIIGPVDDAAYWQSCEREIARLGGRVAVTARGAIEPHEVNATLSAYHFMLLPTHHENFGYVILEALLAGCPVVLSDQTPWRDLADRSAGWVIPLADEARFARAIDECIQMDGAEYQRRSAAAHRYAVEAASNPAALAPLRALLGARADRSMIDAR